MEKALRLALLAFTVRLIVAPFFGHLWDIKTLQETAYYTIEGYNVYELVYMNSRRVSEALGLPLFYEGYAYPPHLILVILPFYLVYLALGGDPQPIKVYDAIVGVELLYELQFHLSKDIFLFLLVIKIPMILADSLITYMLAKHSYKLAFIYAISPYSIFITGIWGMFDSLVALALILTILLLERGRYTLSGLVYGFSLIKVYTLLVLPIILLHLRSKGLKPLASFSLGLFVSQIPTMVYLALNPTAFIFTVIVFHMLRQPSGLTPLRMLSTAENITLTTLTSTIHTVISIMVYVALLAYIARYNVSLKVGVTSILLYFLAFSKVVHEQHYLSVYPILLELRTREARLIEVLILSYGLINAGLFLVAPTLLFLIDYRFVKLHSSIVYGDLGYLTSSFLGPLVTSLITIVTFTVTLRTIVKLLERRG